MPKSGANISLASYDDIFSTQAEREQGPAVAAPVEGLEQIVELNLSELHPFKNHPFKVLDNEEMVRTVESIKEFGVMTPIIVRPDPEGGYEIVSGHRRCHASELADKETIPAIVRNMDDDAATILMVDSNLQRETILPSERAFAYKMKLEAVKHQGQRRDLEMDENEFGLLKLGSQGTSCQLGTKLRSDEVVAESVNESARQLQRYIRLTELTPELLQMVDDKDLGFTQAVELSYLKPEEQETLLMAMDYSQSIPSLSQAQQLKKMSQMNKCDFDTMCVLLGQEKKQDLDKVVLDNATLRKYFPKNYTPKQMQDTIIKLLDQWQKRKQREESL